MVGCVLFVCLVCLCARSFAWLVDWLVGWPLAWFVMGCLVGPMTRWLIVCFVRLVCWLVAFLRLFGLFVCLVGLFGLLVGCLVGWLVG